MYNCVSQVIYYHHPRYARQAQIPLGRMLHAPMHMLPPITQLLPEIPIVYEDDSVVPGLSPLSKGGEWCWLVCCGAIFLLEVEAKQVWRANDLSTLVAFFLARTGRSIAAEDEDDDGKHTTSSGQVQSSARRIITDNSHVVVIAPSQRQHAYDDDDGACSSFFEPFLDGMYLIE